MALRFTTQPINSCEIPPVNALTLYRQPLRIFRAEVSLSRKGCTPRTDDRFPLHDLGLSGQMLRRLLICMMRTLLAHHVARREPCNLHDLERVS